MTTDEATPGRRCAADALPAQTRRRVVVSPADRIVRQVQAIDAWNAARRAREDLLDAAYASRDDRMDAARQVELLRRTQDAITGRTARGLDAEVGPLRTGGATAVIAHRHGWFAEKVAQLLEPRGVVVVECTDNGAGALGAVVTEQPDLVLAGDRLAMMTGEALLAETRLFAPGTLRTVQAADRQPDALRAGADAVFLRHQPPGDVAEALLSLVTGRPGPAT